MKFEQDLIGASIGTTKVTAYREEVIGERRISGRIHHYIDTEAPVSAKEALGFDAEHGWLGYHPGGYGGHQVEQTATGVRIIHAASCD